MDSSDAASCRPPCAAYIVRWDELTHTQYDDGGEEWTLTGHFETVRRYSIQHIGYFDISPREVETGA